jgi:glycosyltransferase involved in cell wall biosynthesis
MSSVTHAPKVSVVIPTFNAAALLVETLRSVLSQSYEDFEVIVVNDGSSDDTLQRLEHFASESRLRIVDQPNAGVGAARNRGIAEARAQYVALLDHDDLWAPDKLAVQVAYMDAHPECVSSCVPWANSDQPARPVCDFGALVDKAGIVVRPLRALAEGHVFLISSCIMFRRQSAAGLFYQTLRRCIEDTPFQIGLIARGPIAIAGDRILMVYRHHPGNYSGDADFFYNGILLLRAMQKIGAFAQLQGDDANDLDLFLAHVARTAAARQLQAGRRLRGLSLFCREIPGQLRHGRWRFLLGFVPLALRPGSMPSGK